MRRGSYGGSPDARPQARLVLELQEEAERLGATVDALQRGHAEREEATRMQLRAAHGEIDQLRSQAAGMQRALASLEERAAPVARVAELEKAMAQMERRSHELEQAQVEAERRSQDAARPMHKSIDALQRMYYQLGRDAAGREAHTGEELNGAVARMLAAAAEAEAVGARQEGIRTEVEALGLAFERCRARTRRHEMALREMGSLGYRPLDVVAAVALMQEQLKTVLVRSSSRSRALGASSSAMHPDSRAERGRAPCRSPPRREPHELAERSLAYDSDSGSSEASWFEGGAPRRGGSGPKQAARARGQQAYAEPYTGASHRPERVYGSGGRASGREGLRY